MTDTLGLSNITIVSDSCYCPKQCPLWQRLVGKMALRARSRCSRAPRRFTWLRTGPFRLQDSWELAGRALAVVFL